MTEETFTVTNQHLSLIRNMYVDYWDIEFGAPGVHPKRPYGNSNPFPDMAEILDIKPIADIDELMFTNSQEEEMKRLHKETTTALQIILRVGFFEPGEYVRDWPHNNWKLKANN